MGGSSSEAGNQTRAGSIPGIERATGREWAEWVRFFEDQEAAKLNHAEIARLARLAVPADLKNPDWWAQGIAIAYEQHAGLRVPGQASDGTFRVGASRSLPLGRDAAMEAWDAMTDGIAEHRGHAQGEPRRSRTEKRTFWRVNLEGAGRVEVSATQKNEISTALAISHEGLQDGAEIEAWRTHWKALLAKL